MPITADILSKEFEMSDDSVLELLKKYTSRNIGINDEVIINPEEKAKLLLILASNSAKCHACNKEYTLGQKQCSCGSLLGRCPVCQHYSSFKLAQKKFVGRDEYKCERCDVDVAECHAKTGKYCYQWAGRYRSTWLSTCPICEEAVPREQSSSGGKKLVESFFEGIGKGLEDIVKTEIKNRKKK